LADIEEVLKQINSYERPDQYPWLDLAKREGWNLILEVVKRLSPEVLPFFPQLHNQEKMGNEYKIPDYHADVLWMYGVFLKMYRNDKQMGVEWFRTSLKPERKA